MSNEAVALIGFVSLFVLMLLRVPVGMAMGLVGITGFGYLTGFAPALKLIGQTTMRTVTDYSFGVIPMFLLMGAFVSVSGISRELFRAANTFVGHWKGGLGIATIAACGGFAAISGSSVATAATFSAVAYPEMRRFGYPQSFATGVIAVGGTLGAMLPPSTVLAVYGIITQQEHRDHAEGIIRHRAHRSLADQLQCRRKTGEVAEPGDADEAHRHADRHAQQHQRKQRDESQDRDGVGAHFAYSAILISGSCIRAGEKINR